MYGKPNKIEDLIDLPAASFANANSRFSDIHYLNPQVEEKEQKMKSVFRSNDPEMYYQEALISSCLH